MSENSWASAHFYTDGWRQYSDKETKWAYCKACLDFGMAALRQSDILATAGGMLQNRTDDELHIACELICNYEEDGHSYIYTVSLKRGKVYRVRESSNNTLCLISLASNA